MFFETNIQDNSGAVKNPVSMLRLLRDDTPFWFEEENTRQSHGSMKAALQTSPQFDAAFLQPLIRGRECHESMYLQIQRPVSPDGLPVSKHVQG